MEGIGVFVVQTLAGWAIGGVAGGVLGQTRRAILRPSNERAFQDVLESALRSDEIGGLVPEGEREWFSDVLRERSFGQPELPELTRPDRLPDTVTGAIRESMAAYFVPLEPTIRGLGVEPDHLTEICWEQTRTRIRANAMEHGHLVELDRVLDFESLQRDVRETYEEVRRMRQHLVPLRAEVSAQTRPLPLPEPPAIFLGRRETLDELVAGVGRGRHRVLVIEGMAGVGKSVFAVELARELRHRFDTVMFLRMNRWRPDDEPLSPETALGFLLGALGIHGTPPPDRRDRWHRTTKDRKLLLVLDNVASEEIVRPLVPSGKDSLVLVTSQNQLSGLENFHLKGLPKTEAARLLEAELDGGSGGEEIERAVGLTQGLPLAIELLARRVRDDPEATLMKVCDEFEELGPLFPGTVDGRQPIAEAFEMMLRRLDPTFRHYLGLLARQPGMYLTDFSASAMLGLEPLEAHQVLLDLASKNLLYRVERRTDVVLYSFHDLLRKYALEKTSDNQTADDHDATIFRLVDHYHVAAVQADRLLYPDRSRMDIFIVREELRLPSSPESAAEWFSAERDTIMALANSERQPTRELALLCHIAGRRFRDRWLLDDAGTCAQVALDGFNAEDDALGRAYALTDLAIVARLQGRYEEARRFAQNAMELFERLTDPSGRAYVLLELGVIARLQGHWYQAYGYAQTALTAFEIIDDLSGRAYALRDLGRVFRRQGPYSEAAECVAAALELFAQIGDRSGQGYALRELGRVYRRTGKYAQARERAHEALEVFVLLEDFAGQGYALRDLGRIARRQGAYDEAADLAEQALRAYDEIDDRSGRAYALRDLGRVRRRQGLYPEARRLAEEAQSMFVELGDRSGQAVALCDLGRVARRQGEYEEARSFADQSRALQGELGDRSGLADALCDLGRVARRQGRYGQAEAHARAALRIFEELGDDPGAAEAWCDLGWIAREKGELAEAAGHVKKALHLHGIVADRAGRAYGLREMGDILVLQGEYADAERHARDALDLYNELGDDLGRANAIYTLGLIARGQQDPSQAKEHWRAALRIYLSLGVPFADTVRKNLAAL